MSYEYEIVTWSRYPNGWENEETEEEYMNKLADKGWRIVQIQTFTWGTKFYLEKEKVGE